MIRLGVIEALPARPRAPAGSIGWAVVAVGQDHGVPSLWGVDFGTSTTVLARVDGATGEVETRAAEGYDRLVEQGGEDVPVVPSTIRYTDDGARLLGVQAGLVDAPGTFRWMKRYVAQRSPTAVQTGGRRIGHAEAGHDFLLGVLAAAGVGADDEVVLTAPVESFEHYEHWLASVAEAAGVTRHRVVDEPTAAALGHGTTPAPGEVHLVFDVGGGTAQATVVRIEPPRPGTSGPGCRVLGKAGDDLGGATIDGWLLREVLDRTALAGTDADAVTGSLLAACERAKEALTLHERATLGVPHPTTGAWCGIELVRSGPAGEQGEHGPVVSFEDLLDRHDLHARFDRVVRRALRAASQRGYDADDLDAVLVVGGTGLVPSVRRTLERVFGRERVHAGRPLDAVARGAAALAAGAELHDHVQHDYAIRGFDRARGVEDLRPCVAAGTPYPTPGPVASMTVRATHDGQRELGIAVVELGTPTGGAPRAELVLDAAGEWRVSTPTADELQGRERHWINEDRPTFLVADPPATAGQARFRVDFGIDARRRLVVTAHDLVRDVTTLREHPVATLT